MKLRKVSYIWKSIFYGKNSSALLLIREYGFSGVKKMWLMIDGLRSHERNYGS